MSPPRMPCGSRKGQAIAAQPSQFLLWWVSQDGLRYLYPDTVREIVAELRRRFADGERIEDELLPDYCDLA